jgi:prevent-host-death family protein
MAITAKDIVPLSQVRARLTELADEVRAGSEKIITRNGESYVAVIDARRLDHYHRLEREHIHLTLLAEAERGLADVEAGRTMSVAELRAKYGR